MPPPRGIITFLGGQLYSGRSGQYPVSAEELRLIRIEKKDGVLTANHPKSSSSVVLAVANY